MSGISVLNKKLSGNIRLSSEISLPKGSIKLQHQIFQPTELLAIINVVHTYQQNAQLTNLDNNIFDMKTFLNASDLDLSCTGFSSSGFPI
jgi:hypothetical protein